MKRTNTNVGKRIWTIESAQQYIDDVVHFRVRVGLTFCSAVDFLYPQNKREAAFKAFYEKGR